MHSWSDTSILVITTYGNYQSTMANGSNDQINPQWLLFN